MTAAIPTPDLPATAVTVDADALERLVRLAHQINRDVGVVSIVELPYECTCGLLLGPGPGAGAATPRKAETAARAKHGAHVAYHVRQALAGRIEFP